MTTRSSQGRSNMPKYQLAARCGTCSTAQPSGPSTADLQRVIGQGTFMLRVTFAGSHDLDRKPIQTILCDDNGPIKLAQALAYIDEGHKIEADTGTFYGRWEQIDRKGLEVMQAEWTKLFGSATSYKDFIADQVL